MCYVRTLSLLTLPHQGLRPTGEAGLRKRKLQLHTSLNTAARFPREIVTNQTLNFVAHHGVMSAPLRLVHLLELADKGPALRAALAEEVAEMLTNWPTDCPSQMRAPCEALLAQAAREVDSDTRARLRVRLYADPELAARVLPRELPERALVEAARAGDVAAALGACLGLTPLAAGKILADKSGRTLAAAAKSIGLSRAAYSALSLLTCGDLQSLEAFDQINAVEAARQLRGLYTEMQATAA